MTDAAKPNLSCTDDDGDEVLAELISATAMFNERLAALREAVKNIPIPTLPSEDFKEALRILREVEKNCGWAWPHFKGLLDLLEKYPKDKS